MARFPGPLSLTSTSPFVGRSAELEFLRTLAATAGGEERRVVLIAGEAGSGKSRLVREFAVDAASAGVLVLYGACDGSSTPIRSVRAGARPPHARDRA
jgi:predicted ATPase